MDGIHSVHVLVRLLKSSTDPPSTPGPSKVEIASLAWSDTSFRAANKGEVIAEWILHLLGQAKKTRRQKDARSTSDPIADPRYWTLLSAVLTAPLTSATRPTRTWLLPLLNRFQLDAIVMELLTLRPFQVLAPARSSLSVLWPMAERKITVDALAECLSAVLDTCAEWERVDEDLCWICSIVVGSYRNAFANTGNKKKLYSSFLTTHLSPWIRAVHMGLSHGGPSSKKQLQDSIYAAGTDTLFSLDALKQPLDTLFDALSLSASITSSLLLVFPTLFSSFLSAAYKHRSSLFVAATSVASGKEEVRKRGMEFVGRFWTLVRDVVCLQEDFEVEKWKSLIGLLEIVERERLFVVHPFRGQIDATTGEFGGERILSEVRDRAVETLETINPSSKGCEAEQVVLSIRLLDVLVQIEYDIVGSVLERVLSAVTNISPQLLDHIRPPSSEFLVHVLDYHIKTRTVHTYSLALLGAVSAKSSATFRTSSLSVTGSFPLAYHLPALGHALRTSLTLTQTTPLATAALQAVESAWGSLKNVYPEEERVAKKRKVTRDPDDCGRTILSNLPSNAYISEGEYSLDPLWDDVGKLGWTVVWDSLIEKSGEHDMVKGRDDKKRKHVVEISTLSTLYPQIATAAALRFLYEVRTRVASLLGDYDKLKEANVGNLLKVVQDEGSDPELVFETIRTVLWHVWYTRGRISEKQMETQLIFSTILDILTSRPLSKLKWSGVSATLTRDNLALAVLYVLTDRWIDALDALASTESLERLIPLLLSVSPDVQGEDVAENPDEFYLRQDRVDITLHGILFNILRNAQFWELHNIRAVFLSSVLTLTASLSSHYFPMNGVDTPQLTTAARTELACACNVYRLLLYVPPEYFTRTVRTELVKRAMAGDVQICRVLEYTTRKREKAKREGTYTEESRNWSRRLMFVRVFLQRMGQFLNTPGHVTSLAFVNHLLSPPRISPPSEALRDVTLDLIELHVVSLLRSREPESEASLSSVISTLVTARPFSQPNPQETWTHDIVQSSVLNLVERLTSDFDPASLSDGIKNSLKTLLGALESVLSPRVRTLLESNSVELEQFFVKDRIDAWSCMLSLTRWLGMSPSIPCGLRLAKALMRSKNIAGLHADTHSKVLRLLFDELWCMPDLDSHYVHLDVVVGFYAVSGGDRGTDTELAMDTQITQSSKKLSVHDFSHLLDTLAEAIAGSGLRADQRERLIRLGKLMLHDAPQGTLKLIQTFATRCFDLFADRKEIYERSPDLTLHCLEFIARHCSDRPAAIRSIDLGSIWSFLHKVLSGSSEHEATTVFSVFHHVITTIGALIRLRRDLVVHTLPHLSLVLCKLMMLTRKLRPQLGAKQTKMVTDTFPRWLSASKPLSPDDARALARLLTTLATKTVPRTHAHATSSTESQKAESLAKPFAKHASYVLVAYVDAFNDPLCIVDAETRRELEPGLFSLCEMVGEYSRDALMLSALDSGGKMIMKSLWGDYEKQRYVGKG